MYRGAQEEHKRIFYDIDKALEKVISIPGGYGTIKAGAIMAAISESTNRLGSYIPYSPFDGAGGLVAGLDKVWGMAYLTANPTTGTEGQVTMDDSYKFAVADHLVACDSDYVQTDLGAITAIDRTTYSHIAAITVTNAFGSETLAKGGAISIQTTTATPYMKAVGILKGAVDTGTGENAKGGIGAMILKNAIAYKDSLWNYNSDVLTDLSGTEDGPYLIF